MTIRHGPRVSRERFETLDEALAAARGRVDEVRREGRLGTARMLREFTPEQRVQARIEISGPGLLRGPEGGIDVMGDGEVLAYSGSIRKRRLPGDGPEEAIEGLRVALS